jgi:hypothetical protein
MSPAVRRRAVLAGCGFAVAAVTALAPAAQAADCTKFASPSGSDSAAGTQASPLRTADELVDSLGAGQTGCLRAGTYAQSVSFGRSGSASAPITLRSYTGERARLVGIVTVRASWVRLAGLNFEGDGSMNTIKIYSSDVVVEDSDITNKLRGRSCMMLGSNDGAGGAVRTIVRRNRFFDCGAPENDNKDHAIYAANLADGRIEDNVFTNSAGKTIQLYPNADRNVVTHNVIDGGPDTVRGGIVIGGDDDHTSSDNRIERNVIAYAADYGIYSNWEGRTGSGNVARSNCVWGAGTANIDAGDGLVASGNVIADPRFLDRDDRDYRLAAGSLCLPFVGYDTAARLLDAVAYPSTPAPVAGAPTVTLTSPRTGTSFTDSL